MSSIIPSAFWIPDWGRAEKALSIFTAMIRRWVARPVAGRPLIGLVRTGTIGQAKLNARVRNRAICSRVTSPSGQKRSRAHPVVIPAARNAATKGANHASGGTSEKVVEALAPTLPVSQQVRFENRAQHQERRHLGSGDRCLRSERAIRVTGDDSQLEEAIDEAGVIAARHQIGKSA